MLCASSALILVAGGCGNDAPALPEAVQAKLPTTDGLLLSGLCIGEGNASASSREFAARSQRELRELLLQLDRAPTATVRAYILYTDKVEPVSRTMTVRELAENHADADGPGIPARAPCYERYRKVLRNAIANSR
jgi:hypothetical protein